MGGKSLSQFHNQNWRKEEEEEELPGTVTEKKEKKDLFLQPSFSQLFLLLFFFFSPRSFFPLRPSAVCPFRFVRRRYLDESCSQDGGGREGGGGFFTASLMRQFKLPAKKRRRSLSFLFPWLYSEREGEGPLPPKNADFTSFATSFFCLVSIYRIFAPIFGGEGDISGCVIFRAGDSVGEGVGGSHTIKL